MTDLALAIASVIVTWWLSTGVVLRIVWLPQWTHRWSLALFSGLALAGILGLVRSSEATTVGAAYLGFGSALAIWAWHELTFLLGVISGPRKLACPPEAFGWQRFRYATEAVIHHELVLALTALALVALTWNDPNQAGTWTFLVLWIMRLSAKLNVFVGVRNLSEEFIPPHLRYLTSYFRRTRRCPLLLASVVAASFVLLPLVDAALAEGASGFVISGHTLVATMLGLAIVEHLFLALPLPDAALWRWILRPERSDRRHASTRAGRSIHTEMSATVL